MISIEHGELAVRMEGGQVQPVIASVLSCESGLIIFDEATSSLDMKNEKSIHQTTLYLRHGHGHFGVSVKHPRKLLFRHLSGQSSYAYGRKCRPCSV